MILVFGLRRLTREAGRDPTQMGLEVWVSPGVGDEDDWRREVSFWKAAGVTHVTVHTTYISDHHRCIAGSSASDHLAAITHRIEWKIITDAATASAALQNGEVDWYEQSQADLVPMLRRNSDIVIAPSNPQGYIGGLRFNCLHPPFGKLAILPPLDHSGGSWRGT